MIIVSHDGFNRTEAWRSVIVVPLSLSEAQARRGPTAVTVGGPNTGLARESTALCHQVTTIDRSKLIRKLGSLDADQLTRVDEGLTAALAL